MASPRDLLTQAKAQIKEPTPAEVEPLCSARSRSWTCGSPTRTSRARSPVRSTSREGTSSSRSRAGSPTRRPRSSSTAPAASARRLPPRRCRQLGYTDVVSMVGGFNRWKDEGRPWATPETLTPDQRNRYQRHLLLPEVGEAGQLKLLDSKVLLLGAGGLGSPAALYLAAAGVGTIGIIDMDVVDASNLQRQILHNLDRIGERKVDSAKKTLTAMNPDVNVVTYDVRLGADNVLDIISGLRRHRRRDRQLPDALPRQRRLAARADPGRARLDLPVRGPGDRLRSLQRPLLPLHDPRAATRRARPVVRRGRRARRAARHRRLDPGPRGHQDAPRAR